MFGTRIDVTARYTDGSQDFVPKAADDEAA
jgi:hypothetical protein